MKTVTESIVEETTAVSEAVIEEPAIEAVEVVSPGLSVGELEEALDPTVRVKDTEDKSAKTEKEVPALIKLKEQLAIINDPLQLIGAESFITKLNDMRDELVLENEDTEKVVGGSLSISAGLSVGYVVWLARSGVILSSVLSAMPAWTFIDPLPVLAGLKSTDEDEDEESLESMVEEKNNEDTESDEPEGKNK